MIKAKHKRNTDEKAEDNKDIRKKAAESSPSSFFLITEILLQCPSKPSATFSSCQEMKVEERFNIEKVKLPPSCLHLFFTRDFCFSYLASQDSCPLKGKGEQEERRGHWKFSHPIRQGGKTLPNWFAIDASSLFSCLLPIHSSFLSFDTMRLCILDDKIRRGTKKTHTGLLCSSAAKSHLSRHGKKKSERLPLLLSTGWTAG